MLFKRVFRGYMLKLVLSIVREPWVHILVIVIILGVAMHARRTGQTVAKRPRHGGGGATSGRVTGGQ